MLASIIARFQTWRRHRLTAKRPWQDWEYLVLDIETSGLDAKQDHIISIGWVVIREGQIQLDSAQHLLLNGAQVEASVGIHLITDGDLEDHGRREQSVIRYLRLLLRDKVLVMHHAPLELSFLKAWWRQQQQASLTLHWLDTLAIERTKSLRASQPIQEGGFRLAPCRARYGLPEYQGHDALTDALATAELLLAQISYQGKDCRLHDLLQIGGGHTKFVAG
ncbi:3'-5' exonuclease [Marinomonas pollencensis]|uniref:DNA polymerase-3 subunit epsilon n=1 Tax=Marinomonas pollencensis TaxID=491954 RepID=A0A3E0DJ41_9GAMM|nr:3'-5' exonuclease [Marinomonas pollencensis]REG82633.1 DNA polymerase-3 subunit epsilon [Marinomonas pollencensis]